MYFPDCMLDITSASGSYYVIQVQPALSATLYHPDVTITGSILLEANPKRKGLLVANLASGNLYIAYGTSASLTGPDHVWSVLIPGFGSRQDTTVDKMARNWSMPYPIYQGKIFCIWEGGVREEDHCHVTELT